MPQSYHENVAGGKSSGASRKLLFFEDEDFLQGGSRKDPLSPPKEIVCGPSLDTSTRLAIQATKFQFQLPTHKPYL